MTEWEEELLDIADNIARAMDRLQIWKDDSVYEIKQFVYGESNWSIQIYADHNPPHFHVKSPNIDACLTISDGELLRGGIDSATHKKIKYWLDRFNGRNQIVECWNKFNLDNKVAI